MARPPSGTDLKLRRAGRRLLQERGLTGLSVRETCRKARVNTGMFHYYFGSREEFLRAVLKDIYAEFMENFKAVVSAGGTPRERLKNALIEVGRFARVMRGAAPVLFADMAYGNREAFGFLSSNFTEHMSHITTLARQCRPASALRSRSVPFLVVSLIPVMVFPVLIGGVMERNGVKNVLEIPLKRLGQEIFSDEGIAARAEIALRGVGL